jgi:hypothetical protein
MIVFGIRVIFLMKVFGLEPFLWRLSFALTPTILIGYMADESFSAVTGIPAWWRADPPRGGARQPPLAQDCPAAGLRQGIPGPPQPSEAQGNFYMYLNPEIKTLKG